MPIPAYVDASAAAYSASGSVNVSYTGSIAAGQILFLHGSTTCTSSDAAVATPSGWTLVGSAPTTGSTHAAALFYKRADGTESGTVTVTSDAATPTNTAGRMYSFSGATSITPPYEADTTTAQGSSTTVTQLSVTSAWPDRLGLHFTAYPNTNTITAFTGETGGDFTEPVAESSATAWSFQVQSASMATAATISGGSATLGTAAVKVRHVLALIGAAAMIWSKPPMLAHHILR